MPRPRKPKMSVSRRRELVIAGLEILVFVLTTGLLAYFSETLSWGRFALTLVAALVVFILLILLRVGPVATYLHHLEAREFELATRFATLGVEKFYNMQVVEEQSERNEDTQALIGQSNGMYLLANSAASYVDPTIWRHWPAVRDRLERGATLNILLLDPFSSDKQIRDKLNTRGDAPDSKFKWPVFYDLYNQYQNVHIQFVDANVYCSLFFTPDAMFYDPYHLGRHHDRIERMFCMKFIPADDEGAALSYYHMLKRHFDVLWLRSVGFEEYVDQNAELIEPFIPSSLKLVRRHRKITSF